MIINWYDTHLYLSDMMYFWSIKYCSSTWNSITLCQHKYTLMISISMIRYNANPLCICIEIGRSLDFYLPQIQYVSRIFGKTPTEFDELNIFIINFFSIYKQIYIYYWKWFAKVTLNLFHTLCSAINKCILKTKIVVV